MIFSLPCCANSGQYVADPLFVIEPAARVGEGERHGGQTLGGRVDDHHGVLLPRLAGLLVPNAAPQVDDLLAAMIGAAGAAQLTSPGEVLGKRLAHAFKAAADVPVNPRRSEASMGKLLRGLRLILSATTSNCFTSSRLHSRTSVTPIARALESPSERASRERNRGTMRRVVTSPHCDAERIVASG